ncbi:MAG: YeeE/YedE family protein [Spirochaetales bacterium]|nr:YeeE/YedE family protein [Spirochaetales bacterium]MCF7937285.1 YeeE/YedE family protein [Spirochaetales bacterium]
MGEDTNAAAPASSGGSTIRRSSSRSRSRKKKTNQIPLGILVFIGIVIVGIVLSGLSENLTFFWLTGIGFGFILQRGRFCFTAAMRDPYLTGGTNLSKAVLVAFAVTGIGFWAIKYGAFTQGLPIPGMGFVVPISLATIVGGFIFGIGMVISGGCASGTLMRVGEGFMMQVLSLVFFIVGSLLGAYHFGWWKLNVILKGDEVFLPDIFGWIGALIVHLLIIVFLWIAADKFAKRKQAAAAGAEH